MESEPLFALFIKTLTVDAMKHPEKLRDASVSWSLDVVEILEGIPDDV